MFNIKYDEEEGKCGMIYLAKVETKLKGYLLPLLLFASSLQAFLFGLRQVIEALFAYMVRFVVRGLFHGFHFLTHWRRHFSLYLLLSVTVLTKP